MPQLLRGNTLYLRMVEPHDAIDVMIWENNPENWHVTDTEVPFSLHGMQQLIEQQQQFRSSGQLRFILCLNDSNESIGTVDLYDAMYPLVFCWHVWRIEAKVMRKRRFCF
jgi:diamine N-acetyltransferase